MHPKTPGSAKDSIDGVGEAVNSLTSPKRDQTSVTAADKLAWSTVDLRSPIK